MMYLPVLLRNYSLFLNHASPFTPSKWTKRTATSVCFPFPSLSSCLHYFFFCKVFILYIPFEVASTLKIFYTDLFYTIYSSIQPYVNINHMVCIFQSPPNRF